MPRLSRSVIPPTDDWEQLRLLLEWPEQIGYELIRPVVVFGRTAAHAAQPGARCARTQRLRALVTKRSITQPH
jgi:putative transposase